MPKISVILCAYNAEAFLEASVRSVLDQTYKNIELILVNDGSTDRTQCLAEKFAEQDARVKAMSISNGGLANARNVGLAAATGEYVAFQDADDTVDLDCYEKMLAAVADNAWDMAVAGYHLDTVLRDGTVSTVDFFEPEAGFANRFALFKGIIGLKSKFILDASWNKLYKRSVIAENGLRFPVGELFEDTAFVLSFLEKACRVKVLPDCFYHYMQRQGNSITKRYDGRKLTDLKKRYFEFLEFCSEADGNVKAFCSLYYIKNVFSALANSYSDRSMSNKERRALIKQETKSVQFKLSAETAKGASKADRLTVAVAKCNWLWLSVAFCKALNYMKTEKADTFAKIK